MPFRYQDLTCVEGGGQRSFNYKTVDAAAAVAAAGYFNEMWENFRLGDVIHVISDVVETQTPGLDQPHLMTGTMATFFVSQLNDGTAPRPLPAVALTAHP
ncbi:MAG: hypothetical protein ACR2QF_04860 [Geminicoccaceae bacterium]